MAAPILKDPILNDVSRWVQHPPRLVGLNGAGVTRYLTHLQRLDDELVEARTRSGRPAIGVTQEVLQISSGTLNAMKEELERLRLALINCTEQALARDTQAQAFEALETALFDEFGSEIAAVEGETASAIALGLLRKWRPAAEKTGHEGHDPSNAGDSGGTVVPGEGDPASGAGAPDGRPGKRRSR